MKDNKYVVIFIAIGLALAYIVSAPLRRDPGSTPRVGTDLGGSTVATKNKGPEPLLPYAEGVVSLGAGLTPDAVKGRTVFIMAKGSVNGKPMGGPPIAAKSLTSPTFPLTYTLTSDDNIGDMEYFEGNIILTARIDKDGVAGPKQPDDYEASVEVKSSGSRKVDLTIQR